MQKQTLHKLILFLAPLFLALPANAQLEIGLQGGRNFLEGDAHCWSDSKIKPLTWTGGAFGAFARYLFSDRRFGARLHYAHLPLKFDERRYGSLLGHAERGFHGSNKANDLGLELEWNLLRHKKLHPYLFAGLGLQFAKYKVNWDETSQEANLLPLIQADKEANTRNFILPIGAGLQWRATDRLGLHLESSMRLPVSDRYDGISQAANPDENDWYGYAMLGLSYALSAAADRDQDGIADKRDECPDVPGLDVFAGCPDMDADGIQDKEDRCPQFAGPLLFRGCPDKDDDTLPDLDDACPEAKGPVALKGCPDRDEDGLVDHDDECPDQKGSAALKGCPDSDGDSVRDKEDECPTEKGTRALYGCPDADGDGIADRSDDCPDKAGSKDNKGCPLTDSDGDGILDAKDNCPTLAGVASNGGCPIVGTPVEPEKTCSACAKSSDPIFNNLCVKPKKLSHLGSNPEFGNSHGLTPAEFYDKLNKAYSTKRVDREFLDRIYVAMGYSGFKDARPEQFSAVVLPIGTSGNLGYSAQHKTGCYTLPDNEKDRMAFRLEALNGCEMHFMKTCGNHFFFCK